MKPASLGSILLSLLPAVVLGQAQVSTGDLRGVVVDASDAAISGTAVTAVDPERGGSRKTTTDGEGNFTLALLAPGSYRLRFEAQGFTTTVLEGVEVRVGDSVALRVEMQVGAVTTEITVNSDPPVVESDRIQQAATLEQARISNLPINRRNYLDFALLTPGVVETNDLVDGTDYRVVQTPQSGLSFGGSNGRGNAFAIDGALNYLNSGGVRPSISQEAVQEFQVNRNSYSAEFGGAFGGTINIVSRSGTNDVRGTLFGFLRHRSIQARNYFDPQKSAFTRGQYGATAGLPLAKDRTFLFAAFERLDRHETAFVPIYRDQSAFTQLTASQQELVDFFSASGVPPLQQLAKIMNQALVTANNPVVVDTFEENSGEFPFGEDNSQVSVRLDHRFSDRHSGFFRANVTDGLSENAQFGALIGLNRGRFIDTLDGTLTGSLTSVLSPSWVMETRGAFGYNGLDVTPNDPFGPEINVNGYGYFGREIFLPSKTIERTWQLSQTWNRHTGSNDTKFGCTINPVKDWVRSETFFSGRFAFGGRVPLGAVLNSVTGDPQFTTKLAASLVALGRQDLVPNLTEPLTALQSYSLGLPEFYQQGFGDPHWTGWSKRYDFFAQNSWRARPGLTLSFGARYQLEVNEEILGTDSNNIAPRLGFAWTPDQGRTVVRGGYGIYFSQNNIQVANVADTLAGTQISQVFVPLTGVGFINPSTGKPLTSADIYQTLLKQGVIGDRQILASDLEQFGLTPGPGYPLSVVFGIVDDFVNPYAQQASFEIERGWGGFALSAGYNFNRAAHIVRILDRNLYYTGTRPDGSPRFGFFEPLLLQKNIFESTANSFYHALVVQASRRFQKHYSLNLHYTWSKAMDEVTDFNTDFQPHDQLNARAERALSSFHQGHRFVANAVIESPWHAGRGRSVAENVFGDWTLSPIVIAGSFRPFNTLTGFDSLDDRHPNTHRPHKAGRNIGQGPDYFGLDFRLSRRFPLGSNERRSIEFIAEVFNLPNHTNFRTVNSVVGSVKLEDLPQPITGVRASPTSPLAYTSAFAPRQFQFGLKINY